MITVNIRIKRSTLYFAHVLLLLISIVYMPIKGSITSPEDAHAVTETITSSTNWTVPPDVYYVTVEAWGGGGGGGNVTSGAAGGGGGAYAANTLRLTPGNSYSVTIGSAGAVGVAGGDTSFAAPTSVVAKGGSPGIGGVGGSGGSAASSTGSTKYSGGRGGDLSGNGKGGGGGGGSATSTANGGDGEVANNGGNGGTGQGAGGAGGGNNSAGSPGVIPGGAGGGGGNGGSSAAGSRGEVVLTYTTSVISVSITDGSINYGIVGSGLSRSTTSPELNDTQTALNDGNITEDFNIRGNNGAVWVLSTTAAADSYVHEVCTSGGGSPDPCDASPTWTKLSTSYSLLSAGVPVSASRRFDLRLTAPTSSSTTTDQSINITVQAVAP